MNRVIGFGVGLLTLLVVVFGLLFLGGLASAWWEIRAEKKAGLVPTRPAWENRVKRRALGGLGPQLRAAWRGASSPLPTCWCGRGPLATFPALPPMPAGVGCAAWEAGDAEAVELHDLAGGYARTAARAS